MSIIFPLTSLRHISIPHYQARPKHLLEEEGERRHLPPSEAEAVPRHLPWFEVEGDAPHQY
jgi:hypothetical protein